MRKRFFNIYLAIFCLWSYTSYSQKNCEVPLSPVLTLVSVQPENGMTEFRWNLSPSDNIAAYIVYTFKDGVGMPVDTLWDPTATSYSFTNTASRYFSVSYVIAAHRMPNCTSPLSNELNTIFCSSSLDTCNKKITVSWNKYPDYPKKVLEYKIFASLNGEQLSELTTVDNLTETLIISDFLTDSEYYFVVRAVLEDGAESTSNKSLPLSTNMQQPPGWINADFASINTENTISLSFTVDPISEINLYSLERKTGISGNFEKIAQLQATNGKVLYIDNQANINRINYYRLSAINSCGYPVTISNLCSNIVLALEQTGNYLNLNWNSCKEWLGNISEYRLFVNTGNGFEEKAVLSPADTSYTLGYQEIMYNVSGDEVCFYISATEEYNPYNINSICISSSVCTTPTEVITVPNIFTPNSGTINANFRPVLSFTPKEYHLVISDRQGNILFETRDHYSQWDGARNGNPQPQGVYIWFLKVVTPSGKSISKSGTLTIINKQ